MQFFNEPLMHDKMGPIQFLHHEIDSRLGHITSKLMNHISNWNIHMTQDEKDALKKLSEAIDDEGQIIVDPSSLFGKFATIDQIPTKVSQLVNDKGFISEIPNYYVTEEELDFKLNNIPVSKYTDYTYINNEISRIYNEITNEYKSYTDTAIAESSISEEHIRQIISDYLEQHGLSVSWENILNKPTWAQGAELPKATRSTFGTVKIGNGIEVEDGVISVTGSSTDTNDVIVVCFYSDDNEIPSDSEFGDDYPAYDFTTHTPLLPQSITPISSEWNFKPDFSKKYVYMLKKTCVKGENNYWGSDWTLIYNKDQSSTSFDDNFAIIDCILPGELTHKYLISKTSTTTNSNWNTFTWLARTEAILYEACYNEQSVLHRYFEQLYPDVTEIDQIFQPTFCIDLTTGNIYSNGSASELKFNYVRSDSYSTRDLDNHVVSGLTTSLKFENMTKTYALDDYYTTLTGTVTLKFVHGLLIGEIWSAGSSMTITPNGGTGNNGNPGYDIPDQPTTGGGGGEQRRINNIDEPFNPFDYEINQINELYGKGTTFNEDDNP